MLDIQYINLSKTRLQKSRQCYISAIYDARYGDYDSANNRAYYSMFHAIRALLALENVDFKKHSSVLGYFNKNYVNTGIFASQYNKNIAVASDSRNSSDYEDHYFATREEAEKNIANAETFFEAVKQYIAEKFKAENIQENLDEYSLDNDEVDSESEADEDDLEI